MDIIIGPALVVELNEGQGYELDTYAGENITGITRYAVRENVNVLRSV